MGLDVYLYTAAQKDHDCILHDDVPSERWPDHLFNRRYLRSSYNDGGFNHAVPDLIGSAGDKAYPNERGSLYWIFEPMGREWDGNDATLAIDDILKLKAAKTRALEVAEAMRNSDRLRVQTVSPNVFAKPPTFSDSEALAMYRGTISERAIGPDDWWSNRDMMVFGDGLAVLAAIPGKITFGIPGVHLIYRAEDIESYIQAAEITAEFCDEAIGLIKRDGSCRISWSG